MANLHTLEKGRHCCGDNVTGRDRLVACSRACREVEPVYIEREVNAAGE